MKVDRLSKSYNGKAVLGNVSFEVSKGSFTSIFGSNGSGKSTLLNIIAGLNTATSGEIQWQDDFRNIKISYVFQNYNESLMPWWTIGDNIALPLKLKGVSEAFRRERVMKLFDQFQIKLDPKAYPYELSGGQRQLVAILRGLIIEPDVMLLDEPFSALDFQIRLYLHAKLLKIWEETRTTIILVSHDLEEAIYLADRVVLMGGHPSRVLSAKQTGLHRPRNFDLLSSPSFTMVKGELLKEFMENRDSYEV